MSTPALKTYDLEIEKAVLGAIMTSTRVIDEVYDQLKVDFFHSENHRVIFKAILELYKQDRAIDIYTLKNLLQSQNELDMIGGLPYITMLKSFVFGSSHVYDHIEELRDLYVKRSLQTYAKSLDLESIKGEKRSKELLDFAEKELFELGDVFLNNATIDLAETIDDILANIQNHLEHGSKDDGVPTGFYELDQNLNGGWKNSDLIIIAARPGMGKTAFTLSMARKMALEHKKRVAFFTLEMPPEQLGTRLLAAECEIPMNKLQNKEFTQNELLDLEKGSKNLKEAKIIFDDVPGLSIFDLRAKARRMKTVHNIDIIIIDYLQLMTVGTAFKSGNREQEISLISRNLKILAKELDIPIIALSQLNRNIETRGTTVESKRPKLSDLRESGAIEQDADIVSFIFRPEQYATEVEEYEKDLAEIIVGKFRNGQPSITNLKFEGKYVRFSNWADTQKSIGESKAIDPMELNGQASFDVNQTGSDSRFSKDDAPF